MSHRFDATLKDLFSHEPSDFATVPVFEIPKIEPACTLNSDLSTVSAATDVAFGFGQPLRQIVDLNFQSGPDKTLPARSLLYNAAFHLRYDVPVRSTLVLLRPKADAPNLTGKLFYVADGKALIFEYGVVRMWQQPVEPFLHGALGLLPLATLCQIPEGKSLEEGLRDIVRAIDRRLSQEKNNEGVQRLMTAALILTGLRVLRENLHTIYQGVRVMHESTAFDMFVEEGRQEGRKEGREEGRKEGEAEFLLKLGTFKFGTPGDEIAETVKALGDLNRIERMGKAIFSVTSWEELLSTP